MFRYDQKVPSTHTLQRCLCQVVGCDSSGKGERNAWATLTGNQPESTPSTFSSFPHPQHLVLSRLQFQSLPPTHFSKHLRKSY